MDRLAARLTTRGVALPRAALEAVLCGPLRRFLSRPGKQLRARLVEIGWSLGGGVGQAPAALAAAIEALHAGSLIVDDAEDGSLQRRGAAALHREIGLPLAVNAGSFLYFAPFELVHGLGLPAACEIACSRRINDTLLRCHAGQALDLGLAADTAPRAALRPLATAASEWKTGALMGLALALAATAAGAASDRAEALDACGVSLGVGFQMLDDLENLVGVRSADKRGEDLRLGRVTWPWAWAAEAANGDPARFDAWRACGRQVRLGAAPYEPLAEALTAAIAHRGHAEAETTLRGAVESIEREVGRVAASGLADLVRTLCSGAAPSAPA